MGAHDFWDARPRELYPTHNLVANDGVIGHLAEFFRLERSGLAEEALVYCNFADIVQVTCGPKRGNVARFHAHGFSYARGVASYAQ